MSAVASKNLYDLLGNDPDQDPELRTPEPPVIPVDKPAARAGKRNAPAEAPVKDSFQANGAGRGPGGDRGRGRGDGRGRGRGRARGSDGAFLDSDAGRNANREKPTEDGFRENDRGGRFREGGRGRGGRGRGGARGGRDDRHSHNVHGAPDDQAKQAAHGWGGETGNDEWADEAAGQAIAEEEKKDDVPWDAGAPADTADDQFGDQFGGGAPAPADDQFGGAPAATDNAAPIAEPEPEDNSKSYADYLAEQAEKKLQLGGALQARQANEGAKNQPEGKKVERQETDFFAGSGPKTARQRERKTKETVLIDNPQYAAREQDSGFRGGRGRGRGEGRGRGRGEGGFRGEREDRGERGEGRGRGFRGARDGEGGFRGRGGPRGGANAAQPNVSSAQDFPGLGGS